MEGGTRTRLPAKGTRMTEPIPYLTLDPRVEEAIRADRAAGWKNPCAFDDAQVTRREPNPHDEATLARPAFARDIEKILNVPAYNRYADKTQVFSFVENDDICRRGLHVQLVSRIARGIGALLGLNCELHRGHRARARRGAHAVRPCGRTLPRQVLPCAHRALLQPQRALGARAGPAVPPQREPADARRRAVPQRRVRPAGAARGRASGFDELDARVETCCADERAIKQLRPSTLEGCVVRVSDMIAYVGKDRAGRARHGRASRRSTSSTAT